MSESIKMSHDFINFPKILGYNEDMIMEVTVDESIKAAKKAERYIIKQLSEHKKTGTREKSIFWEYVKERFRHYFRVASDDDKAPYLEFGTRGPYEIVPKKPGGVLRFWSRKTNNWAFAKRVTHPGIKANPAFTDAFIRFFYGLPGRIVNSINARARAGGK